MKPAAPDKAKELAKARTRVLRWLSYRARSIKEAQSYLEQKGFPGPVIEAVLAEMRKYRYLDDERFADEYVQNCLRRGLGPIRARFELQNKGVHRQIIDTVVERYFSEELDLKRAVSLLQKRLEHDRSCRDKKWLRRQASFLKSRGYGEATVIKALQRFYGRPIDETLP